jgi:hypothetical protein
MGVRTKYAGRFHSRMGFYDPTSQESLFALFPVMFYDDFIGYKGLEKYVSGENTVAKWGTTETNLNLAIGAIDDTVNGIAQITLDSDDNAEVGALYFGDNLCLSLEQGLIFETRLTFHVLPTTGTETVQAVFGLASAHNTTLDSIATNAWFRVESAAQTALLWEVDSATGANDDNDNSAGITLVADTYHVYKIDCTDISAVKFYVDGNVVGTGDMSGLAATEDKVQPYFNLSKAVSSNNTGTGTMYIDYVKIWQNRAE